MIPRELSLVESKDSFNVPIPRVDTMCTAMKELELNNSFHETLRQSVAGSGIFKARTPKSSILKPSPNEPNEIF